MGSISPALPGAREATTRAGTAQLALALVAGIALLDLYAAQALTRRRRASPRERRDYSGRSGFPRGVERSRGLGLARACRFRAGRVKKTGAADAGQVLAGQPQNERFCLSK